MENFSNKTFEERNKDLLESLKKLSSNVQRDEITLNKISEPREPKRLSSVGITPEVIVNEYKTLKTDMNTLTSTHRKAISDNERLNTAYTYLKKYENLRREAEDILKSNYHDVFDPNSGFDRTRLESIKKEITSLRERLIDMGIESKEHFKNQYINNQRIIEGFPENMEKLKIRLSVIEKEAVKLRQDCKIEIRSLNVASTNAQKSQSDVKKVFDLKMNLKLIDNIVEDISRSKNYQKLIESAHGNNLSPNKDMNIHGREM